MNIFSYKYGLKVRRIERMNLENSEKVSLLTPVYGTYTGTNPNKTTEKGKPAVSS